MKNKLNIYTQRWNLNRKFGKKYMKTFQYRKKINKKKLEVRKRKRVERSSDDPSSSIKRGEIPVCAVNK